MGEGMNPLAEMEIAATALLRAKELATWRQWPQEEIDRIDLLKRAVAKQREIFAEKKAV
jgi:hypothetical protein